MKRLLPHVFICLAICATTLGICLVTNYVADEDLRLAVDDIENDCDDQLTLLLHANACDFAYRYGATNGLSHEAVLELCDYCCIDEFSLVGADGRFIDTTDPGSKAGESFFTDEEKQAPYRALLDGRRLTVRQRFRPSATDTNKVFKFFAMSLPGGRFLQIGYLWESFEREFERLFLPIFETRRIGETGFCVVLDEKDSVAVSIPGHPDSKGKSAAEIGFTAENLSVPLGQVFRADIYGTGYRCMSYPEKIARYRVYAVVPLSERQGPAIALSVGVALVLLAAYLVFRLILAKFRQQQAKIDALREEEEKRRAEDLALARSIQCAELRKDGTDGDGYRIATMMNAAREVGGDFYDYYELPDGRLVVTIADVSGKGVPAAFFMMKARMTLKSCVFSCVASSVDADVSSASTSLAAAVARANVRLSRNNPAEMFVTALVGVYDRKTGTLDYVSAGHNPPGKVERLKGEKVEKLDMVGTAVPSRPHHVEWLAAPRCPALGVFESAKYRAARTTLASGDRLFLYTDGVTEAMNPAGELFGNERLEAILSGALGDRALPSAPSATLIPTVSRALETFVAGAEQSDDITMLELVVEPNSNKL